MSLQNNNSRSSLRKIMSVVILLLLMYMNQLFTGPTPKAVLSLWIWCSYSIILFIPKRLWTQPRLILAFITIIALESHQQIKEGFGLSVMKARLEERGGELRYAIAEPNGFEIVAEIGMEM
ncbi:hypothetical protein ACHHV8_12965 [Paenibacillus sp. TAB 01]|uniref:hypothetical protein n=1 Tax=Paenibacillus sp. TAB 01 TaxID=3368988 RepID=UPI003753B534